MIRFSKKVIKTAIKQQNAFMKAGKGIKTIKMTDVDGKQHKVQPKEYFGILKQWNLFYENNGRAPNYVTYVGKTKHPFVIHYQSNGYTCGPSSFKMAIQRFGDYYTESAIAKACGTTSSGTAPSDLIAGAKKLGYTMKTINRNITGVKNAVNAGKSVIAHIDTARAKCLGYSGNYGHYVMIARSSAAGNYWVFDPTKGFKKCKASVLDGAMLNRTINYYSVEPK